MKKAGSGCLIVVIGIVILALAIALFSLILFAGGIALSVLGLVVLVYPKILDLPIFEKLERFKLRHYARPYGAAMIVVGIFLAIIGGFLGQELLEEQQADKPPTTKVEKKQTVTAPVVTLYKVVKVTDGDTFDVVINGKNETVRMLLIDTPETVHPNKPVQPFAKEASAFTTQLLSGKSVKLEADKEDKDKYGRLLRYVYIDGKSVQEQLLEKGFARVSVSQPNTKYVDKYQQIETEARNKKIAVWSIPNYVQASGFVVPTPKPVSKPAPKPQPKPEPKPQPEPEPNTENVYYANCSEAKSMGAAPLYKGEPGYRSKLDRDKDGVACE